MFTANTMRSRRRVQNVSVAGCEGCVWGGGAGAQWTMTLLQQMSKQAFWLPEKSPVCYMQPLVTAQRENT